MALTVSDDCICCAACVGECPKAAITLPDQARIDPEACDECGGEPLCVPVCPMECIVPLEPKTMGTLRAERAA